MADTVLDTEIQLSSVFLVGGIESKSNNYSQKGSDYHVIGETN